MDIIASSKDELCKTLWLKNEPKLRRLCAFKLSSHPDEVEDVLADTALILWKAILNDRKIEYPDSWLYTLVNNLIKKKYTELNISKERKAEFNEENLINYKLNVGYNQENFLLTDIAIEKIWLRIENMLTPDEKQLVGYIYDDRLKMKEIADLLSTTESAIKQKNYRLNRKIKRWVKEYLENM